MLPNKLDKLLVNNNYYNNYPYPAQVDKEQSKDKNENSYTINQ